MKDDMTYEFRTENDLLVRVRPLRAADAPLLIDIFEHLGADSRYQRFNLPLSSPDPAWVEATAAELADVDAAQGAGWLALADLPEEPNAPVAGARYLLVGPETAEVSVTVRDDLQGMGIGTRLLKYLAQEAYKAGVRTLAGTVQSNNINLWRSLANLDVPIKRERQGTHTRLEVELSDALFDGEPEQPVAPSSF